MEPFTSDLFLVLGRWKILIHALAVNHWYHLEIRKKKSHTTGRSTFTILLSTYKDVNIANIWASSPKSSFTCLADMNNSSLASNSVNDTVMSKKLIWTSNLHLQQTQETTLTYPTTFTLANSSTTNHLSTPETSQRSINFPSTCFNPASANKRLEK